MNDIGNFQSDCSEIFNLLACRKFHNVEALGGIHEKYWVESKGKKFLFKFNESDEDYSDFGEVLTSYLSCILGVNCVKCMFCKDLFSKSDRDGVLVADFKNENVEETISFRALCEKYLGGNGKVNFSTKFVEDLVGYYAKDYNLHIDKDLSQNLKEMALMDYLLIQTDRHKKNIEFLIENVNGKKTIKVAPMFDNAYCLFLSHNKAHIVRCLNNDELSPITPRLYIGRENYNDDIEIIFFAKELAKELLENEKLMKIFTTFTKMDLRKEIGIISKFCDRILPNEYITLATREVEKRTKMLSNEILKLVSKEKFEKGEENEIVL